MKENGLIKEWINTKAVIDRTTLFKFFSNCQWRNHTKKKNPITSVGTHMFRQIKGTGHSEIKIQNHLLTLMLFQTSMTDFLLWNTKDILKNVLVSESIQYSFV